MESFSYLFQSLTVSNRLSINLFAGSLLTALISVAVVSMVSFLAFSLVYFLLVLIVGLVSFEFLNSSIQLFIFGLLTLDYLLIGVRMDDDSDVAFSIQLLAVYIYSSSDG